MYDLQLILKGNWRTRVTCTQALYKCKQDKYPYNYTCNYDCDCNHDYPLYKYLPEYEYSPEAYILESIALVVKQCKQVFYLPGIGL